MVTSHIISNKSTTARRTVVGHHQSMMKWLVALGCGAERHTNTGQSLTGPKFTATGRSCLRKPFVFKESHKTILKKIGSASQGKLV